MTEKNYLVDRNQNIPFHNGAFYCIGTGRIGLALQKEYQDQLRMVQNEIGFSHIRGHGIFAEDMAIFQEYEDEEGKKQEYNFTYLDRVMDSYLELGIKPFLELGFMPEKMASGIETVFYWKGNITPPKRYEDWIQLVQATLCHLIERYTREEVVTWPVEVWNEPNLPIFWKNADMEKYFELFVITFRAVKEVDKSFRIGGPAICGTDDELWMKKFLEFCEKEDIPLDFCTRHHYAIHPAVKEGHYTYVTLMHPEMFLRALHKTRQIIDSFDRYKGLELHITEFNTSYRPDSPLHDTNQNAAYVAWLLSQMGNENTSYSYWTFGDVFEELGVPFTPFHGGFGLIANGCIPKPTFWTFYFYKQLCGQCVHRSEEAVILKNEEDEYRGIAWNLSMSREGEEKKLIFALPAQDEQTYCILIKNVDEVCCNPLKVWYDMGEPGSLTAEQKKLLTDSSIPQITSMQRCAVDGILPVELIMKQNGVQYFEIKKIRQTKDRGFSYEKAVWEEVDLWY